MDPITFTCITCQKPINPGSGALRLDYSDLDATATAWADLERRQAEALSTGDPHLLSAADLTALPGPARWRVQHDNCAPTGTAYVIDTNRVRTLADALDWTLHLLGKSWIQHTDWALFLRRVLRNNELEVNA